MFWKTYFGNECNFKRFLNARSRIYSRSIALLLSYLCRISSFPITIGRFVREESYVVFRKTLEGDEGALGRVVSSAVPLHCICLCPRKHSFCSSSPDNPLWETSTSDSPRTSAAASRPPPGCRRAARTERNRGWFNFKLGLSVVLKGDWEATEGEVQYRLGGRVPWAQIKRHSSIRLHYW